MKMKMKMKNRSHRYVINRPESRNEHKYCKYKSCLSIKMLICKATPKQHLKLNSCRSYTFQLNT